jgi:hypothetical protein
MSDLEIKLVFDCVSIGTLFGFVVGVLVTRHFRV